MSNDAALEALSLFFAEVEVAGLKLPDGWFGRPFDNWHELTSARREDNVLVVELDGQLRLTFAGPVRASLEGNILRLTHFARLDWDWTEYGSAVPHHERFESGVVEFVGPP